MRNFISQNWLSIVIIGAFLIYCGILAWQKKWDQLRGIAYKFMLQAEKVITGTKAGRERFELVFAQVYSLIPPWIRFFFPVDTVREQLQSWFVEIKDYMDNGKIDGSEQQALR